MNTTKNELIVKNEEGNLILIPEIEERLDYYKQVEKETEDFKKVLLDALLENNLTNVKCGKYTFSPSIPKNTIKFDKEKFLQEESTEVLQDLCDIKISRKPFDVESFREQYPELYNKFAPEVEEITVDEKKLAKYFPSTYNKYITEIVTDRKPSLRITVKDK